MNKEHRSSNVANVLDAGDVGSFSARQRILAAALKLFVEQGYFNTNVPDLSRVSVCSVGSIYHNFKNKEEVATALYEEGISAFRQALQDSMANVSAPEDVIKTIVKSFLLFSEANYQLSKYLWLCRHSEFMSGFIKHPTRVGFNKLGRTLTKAVKGGIRGGVLKPLKANVIWSVLFGIPLAYVRDWLDGYNKEPPHTVADELADICWKALKKD
jgi:TetR/AcrR family transcriptional regulator, repressor of fatR-cypB operon